MCGLPLKKKKCYFYRHYGQASIDPVALAYYRCERNLIDLSVECPHIFSSTLSDQDRALSLEIITWLFLPGGSIEMAYKAADRVPSQRVFRCFLCRGAPHRDTKNT